ncbi:DUF2934 domain-containing protein [Paracoccus liaowanqingii]|uniref:DUF2934 domain-containing protein n=2 Tax=Paracoccus liaowanqingii TaxID=2560053 RepID=A0A4Z1CAE8_9RHOB|nr:DUF2934 domain-containing protein [Paracoccus liaowanqingii]
MEDKMMDDSTPDRNEAIRSRAHEIWESEGCPEGREAEHWARAESELFATDEGGALSDTAAETGTMHEAMPDASGSDAMTADAAPDASAEDASGLASTGDNALGAKPARKPRRKPAAK